MAAEKSTHQSVEKALAILHAFREGESLRASDIARAADVGQSTASRLLGTLEAAGFVEREASSSLYVLGAELITLAGAAVNRNPVHSAGRQVAQSLAFRLGLGVNMAIRRGTEAVYLCSFEGSLSPKSHTLMGQRVPLHATSVGKCLLLGMTRNEREEHLTSLPPFTADTITELWSLDEEATRIERRGYATELEEYVLGRASIAAPIRDNQGLVVAAVSISGPRSAIDLDNREAELARVVVETADSISSGLGYHGPKG